MTYRIITFVGASWFENYQVETNKEFREYSFLKKRMPVFNDWYQLERDLQKIEKKVAKGVFWHSKNSSAEIKSIYKIAEEIGHNVEVHLITTDTVLSVLAAKLIKRWFDGKSHSPVTQVDFDFGENDIDREHQQQTSKHIVRHLHFNNAYDYQKGIQNLQQLLHQEVGLAQRENKRVYLNITAGYKAITPIVTMFAQTQKIPLLYMYDEYKSKSANPLISY